jgi:hypothetical protein
MRASPACHSAEGGMKNPFKRDTAASLQRVIAERGAAEARIADLQSKRAAALLESDDLEQVQILDAQIATSRQTLAILADKIVALEAQLRREEIEAIAKQRAAAIEVLERKFADRLKLAEAVEVAVKTLGDAWEALLNSRSDIVEGWPADFERPAEGDLRSRIDREMAWALFGAGKPAALRPCSIPAPSNIGLGIAGISAKGIAGAIKLEHDVMLDRLRNLPLPDAEPKEAAA